MAKRTPTAKAGQAGAQLDLWGYVVMARQVERDGGPSHPEIPDDYPDRRPRTYHYCQAIGLGDRMPCAFATCRHSLLSDELRGQMHSDSTDLWTIETCSRAVERRGRHSSRQVAEITGHVEPTIEEWSRRVIRKVKLGLGLEDFNWPPARMPKQQPDKAETAPAASASDAAPPPCRSLSRSEVVKLYGAALVSRKYQGKPK